VDIFHSHLLIAKIFLWCVNKLLQKHGTHLTHFIYWSVTHVKFCSTATENCFY